MVSRKLAEVTVGVDPKHCQELASAVAVYRGDIRKVDFLNLSRIATLAASV